MVRSLRHNLTNERAKIRWLDHFELSASILCRIAPRVRRSADKIAQCRLAIAEIKPMHGQHDIDNARDLARYALTFGLQMMFDLSAFIGRGFERADQDDIKLARALQVMKCKLELACVQSIGGAQIRLAGTLGESLG